MPQVHDRLVAEFNLEPEIYDPDEAVAKGAALYGLKESLQEEVQEILAQPRPGARMAQPGRSTSSDVPEEEVAEALDHLEKQLGFTLTGPVRELVSTRIVNVLSKSLGVVARDQESHDIVVYLLPRNTEVPMERISDFGTDAANQAAVDIRVMAGERDSTEPTDCQDVGVGHAQPSREAPRAQPDPRQVRHQPGRPAERLGHRPDRRRLDRRRVRDRGRDERRAGRGAVDGAAAADGVLTGRMNRGLSRSADGFKRPLCRGWECSWTWDSRLMDPTADLLGESHSPSSHRIRSGGNHPLRSTPGTAAAGSVITICSWIVSDQCRTFVPAIGQEPTCLSRSGHLKGHARSVPRKRSDRTSGVPASLEAKVASEGSFCMDEAKRERFKNGCSGTG